MRPAPAEHRRDDLDLWELFGGELERVPVEDDQVGEETGDELAAAALVPRKPGGSDRRRLERLVERQRLFRVPGT